MLRFLVATVCAALLLAGSPAGGETLRIGGTGSGLAVLALLAKDFAAAQPAIRIDLLPSLGSTGGIKAVTAGATELAISSRPLSPDEQSHGLNQVTWARTALVFAVPQASAVAGLTTDQLIGIYAGTRSHWPDGHPIRLILRPPNDVESVLVSAISPAVREAYLAAQRRPGVPVAMTDGEAADMLAATPDGFCSSTLGMIEAEERPLRILDFNGVHPSMVTLQDGSYPLVKTYILVTAREETEATRAFKRFLVSDAVRHRLLGWHILLLARDASAI